MRFLFITNEYPPNPDASGAIVKHLTDELKKQGHAVDVIARDKTSHIDAYDSGNIYWIEMSLWGKLQKKIREGRSD